MSSSPLPIGLYQGLLDKLVAILELVQTSGDSLSVQNKQALFQATTTFKNTLAQARELGVALPGGEMLTQDQDEVIQTLEELRDRKRNQLAHFSDRVLSSVSAHSTQKIEVDSMASTPIA